MYGGGSGVSVPARMQPTAAMIFLHGLGDTGNGWAPAFPLQGVDHVQTILPTADEQPVSMNMGYRMPSWFDIRGLDEDAPDDEMGIMSSVQRVDRIVDEQLRNGIPEHRIVVGGFSQGGAVALTYGLRTERKLAGIIALSSWLPLVNKYPMQLSAASKDLEVFMGHGTADQVSFRRHWCSVRLTDNYSKISCIHSFRTVFHFFNNTINLTSLILQRLSVSALGKEVRISCRVGSVASFLNLIPVSRILLLHRN